MGGRFGRRAGAIGLLVLTFAGLAPPVDASPARCLFVSSYHRGYAWSDGVERGLRSILDGKCRIKQFDMDTKRRKSEADKVAAALRAKQIIESWKPDVVITADDNAAKYLIQPHYKDHALPFVFNGVNWSADEYGFPYANVTGMIEVALVRPMLEQAVSILGTARRAYYIGAATLTEEKNLRRFEAATADLGLELESELVATRAEWLAAYGKAQEADFVILGSNAGINDWDEDTVVAEVLKTSRKLSVTNHEWMMPFTVLGITKVPEEHGEWSGKVALAILEGMAPSSIPIVANRKRDVWVNEAILAATALSLPARLMRKAKKIGAD